eukprot:TRINITY_DN9329_c0_g1_i8.p2 TRINITY_DN9329_c0_g1~~TRINITY_DN9329_c0_g1_i8.p2  ORF type:complete len:120 (+),score=17.08 TRINITY_DN9329_c0_g1_i8:279-638(+)
MNTRMYSIRRMQKLTRISFIPTLYCQGCSCGKSCIWRGRPFCPSNPIPCTLILKNYRENIESTVKYKVNKAMKENKEVEEELRACKQQLEMYKEAIREADLSQELGTGSTNPFDNRNAK